MAAGDVTTLLRAWGSGDRTVSDELFETIYSQLRAIARQHLRAQSGLTLTPTVLINEAFLELNRNPKNDWRDRVQFFAFTATVMRRLMSAHARRRSAAKRGSNAEAVTFEDDAYPVFDRGVDAAELDDALTELEQLEPLQARIVELRFFGGLTVEEAAQATGMSERTVIRQWGFAKVWLAGRLGAAGSSAAGLL